MRRNDLNKEKTKNEIKPTALHFQAERKGHSTRYRGRDHECRIRNRARVVKRLGAGIGLSVPPCSRLPDLPRAARSGSSPRLPLRPVRLSSRSARSLGLQGIGFGMRISDFGFRISDFGLRISDFGFRISDFGFRISDFGFRISKNGFSGHREFGNLGF